MTNRRAFLASTAGAIPGLMFCGCSLLQGCSTHAQTVGQAGASASLGLRRSRVKTIDVHAHCFFQDALDVAKLGLKDVIPAPVKGTPEHIIVLDQRLKSMDAMGIDMQVLGINPFWYRENVEMARAVCTIQNEKLAQLCALKPDRFAAFASLTLQNPQIAVQQLETAIRKQGLKGAAIGGSVAGEAFSDPKYHPVWAKAQELGAVLFIHPQSTPELNNRFRGNGWLSNVIGNPLDTTIALEHLVFEGTLDKFPGLKVLAAHGGGYFSASSVRSDVSCYVSPSSCNPAITLKKKPSEYAKQIYYDSLVISPEALRNLVAQVGASQVMIGTDQPIPWNEAPIDHVMAAPGLSDAQRDGILGLNAARLLGIPT
ncbi:amidohydrolase family protein [Caenimonas terrae]|uniref:Amidohydrolase family protein n=1 Tax=Caenimonas terrae TaxID=696074 RepID=A0ABW0N8Q8_9BURK